MKHKSSQILFSHWNEKRAGRALPERSEIDPGAIRGALGDTFILAFNPLTEHPFRLAGTRVCALFGRELKGSAFRTLWSDAGEASITRLAYTAFDDRLGIVAAATGISDAGECVDLELLLLPLTHCGQTHLRLIGTLAPLTAPYWLGAHRIVQLALGEYRYLGHPHQRRASALAVAAAAPVPRMRHGLTVYDGGQAYRQNRLTQP
jgi:hypothetical protein